MNSRAVALLDRRSYCIPSDEKLMSHNLRMEWNVTHAIILMNSPMTGTN